jgi:thiamine transport system substrate-binding protein
MNWKSKVTIVVVALVVLSASYAVYVFNPSATGGTVLTIYTYSSLFTSAPNVSAVNSTVFGGFEREYHVRINLVRIEGTQNMLEQLIKQKSNPQADLVIGLTNLQAPQAVNSGVLLNYTPPNLAYVPGYLVNDLDPTHHLVPYEYAPITVDYCNLSSSLASNLSFTMLENPVFARQLVVENPSIDSTGLSFLIYQAVFYQYILHENWQSWWRSISTYVRVVPTWDDAFTIFPTNGYNMVVSYGTDPAYFNYFGGYPGCGTSAVHFNGKTYTWLEIEGIGIVKGAKHLALAQAFENWFLSSAVQSEIPEGEWMFPANSIVPLPPVFSHAVSAEGTVVLNSLVNQTQIALNVTSLVQDWVKLMAT